MIEAPQLMLDPPALVETRSRSSRSDRSRRGTSRSNRQGAAPGAVALGVIVLLSDGTRCEVYETPDRQRFCVPVEREAGR